jgi:hypothetical protein
VSTNIYWRPINPDKQCLPKDLKYKIARKYWGHDGSLGGEPVIIDKTDYAYFEGLKDAGVEGAEEIINAIDKYGEIEIMLV